MSWGRAVVRVRTAGVDLYGDPISGEDRLTIQGCALAPRQTALEGERQHAGDLSREGVIGGYTLYAPHGADIGPDDQIDVDGEIWDVEGQPGRWASPYTGRRPGLVAALRRAEG